MMEGVLLSFAAFHNDTSATVNTSQGWAAKAFTAKSTWPYLRIRMRSKIIDCQQL
jgi:hypothetical protein